MLTIGIDTYATVAEADAEIAKSAVRYTDSTAEYWSALTEEQKENYLADALDEMENTMYTGRKQMYTQELQFPRFASCQLYYTGIPKEVKAAQAEIALQLMRISLMGDKSDGKKYSSARAELLMRKWTRGQMVMGGASR